MTDLSHISTQALMHELHARFAHIAIVGRHDRQRVPGQLETEFQFSWRGDDDVCVGIAHRLANHIANEMKKSSDHRQLDETGGETDKGYYGEDPSGNTPAW